MDSINAAQNYDSPLLIPFFDEDGDCATVLLPTVSRAAAQFFTSDFTYPFDANSQANNLEPVKHAVIANLAYMFLQKNLVGFGDETAKSTGYPGEGGSWVMPGDSGFPA